MQMPDTKWIDRYLVEKTGTEKDFKKEWQWERYMVGGKMYAATCCPSEVYAAEYANHPLLTLKCDPIESGFLREKYSDILPGFYTDKRNWISIKLDGAVSKEIIEHLCDASYELVFSKLTKKMQREIKGEI